MEPAVKENDFEACARCMQPVRHNAIKCTHCGMPRTRTRAFTIWLGVAGLVALVFVIVIMVKVIQDADLAAAPPDSPDAEETSSPSKPSAPDKPPPLNK